MGKLKKVGAVLMAVVVGLVSIESTAASPSREKPELPPQELAELSETLHAAISDRNQQLLTGHRPDSIDVSLQRYSAKYRSKITAEYDELNARKSRLAEHGQGYSDIHTAFGSEKFEVSGDTATATVVEQTELTYIGGGPPERYRCEQVVEFSRSSTGWVIDSIQPKSSGGIPPSTLVSAEQGSHASRGANELPGRDAGQPAPSRSWSR